MKKDNVKIYRWEKNFLKNKKISLLDTTLRDGIQTPGIRQPTFKEKIAIIDLNAEVGIEEMDICLPGVGGKYFSDGVELTKYIKKTYPDIKIVVLARTTENDINATLRFSKEAHVPLNVILFRGSSDLRLIAEDWQKEKIIEEMYSFTKILTKNGQHVICATEDTTRTSPSFLKQIFESGIRAGAQELCIADTVGFATPFSIQNLIKWVKKEITSTNNIKIQFHGHDDLHMSVANSLAALKAGANTIHVTWLGIGERAGNTSLEPLLGIFESFDIPNYNISVLQKGTALISQIFDRDIAVSHSLVGKYVFTTSSGIHAAAIIKAERKNLKRIAGIVYTPIAPDRVGRKHNITVGPLSGKYNVESVLNELGVPFNDDLCKKILSVAKKLNKELTSNDIFIIIDHLNKMRNTRKLKNKRLNIFE